MKANREEWLIEQDRMRDTETTFDEATHTYRIRGDVVPSVTQVIRATLPGAWQASDFYLGRGRALHHACALSDRGKLNEETVDPSYAPKLRAWRKFIADSGAVIHEIELRLSSSLYRYAGTVDRVLRHDGHWVVCDIKSTIEPRVIVQLGGYSKLLDAAHDHPSVTRGVAVELKDSGSYECKWYTKAELNRGEQTFLAALTVYNFLTANNLMRKDKTNGDGLGYFGGP